MVDPNGANDVPTSMKASNRNLWHMKVAWGGAPTPARRLETRPKALRNDAERAVGESKSETGRGHAGQRRAAL